MNRTKSHGLTALLAAIVIVAAGCDPYEAANKAAPVIQRVDAIDAVFSASIDPVEVTAANADGSFTVNGVSLGTFNANFDPSLPIDPKAATLKTMPQCHSHAEITDACQWASSVALVIQSNTLLDGDSIQTSPEDCTPKPGSFTITPAAEAGSQWYTCYNPTSATAGEGASIVVFQSDTPDDPLTGAFLPLGNTTVVGTVKARTGAAFNFNVTVAGVTPAPDYPAGFNPDDPANFQ